MWFGISVSLRIFQFVVIHRVKGFSIVSEAEVNVSLGFSCFFCDPVDVGNLISSSSAFYKSSLYIWKFSVHVLLKTSLESFEHCLVKIENEHICLIVGGSDGKASVYNVGDQGSSPGLGRSTGEGNGNPLQYYCLENPMDRGAW